MEIRIIILISLMLLTGCTKVEPVQVEATQIPLGAKVDTSTKITTEMNKIIAEQEVKKREGGPYIKTAETDVDGIKYIMTSYSDESGNNGYQVQIETEAFIQIIATGVEALDRSQIYYKPVFTNSTSTK